MHRVGLTTSLHDHACCRLICARPGPHVPKCAKGDFVTGPGQILTPSGEAATPPHGAPRDQTGCTCFVPIFGDLHRPPTTEVAGYKAPHRHDAAATLPQWSRSPSQCQARLLHYLHMLTTASYRQSPRWLSIGSREHIHLRPATSRHQHL